MHRCSPKCAVAALLVGLGAACGSRGVAIGDGGAADSSAASPLPDLPPAAACRIFDSLGGQRRLADFATRRALFSRDSATLIVLSAQTKLSGDLYQIALPSGAPALRAKDISDVEWLGSEAEAALLARRKLASSESYDLVLLPFPAGPEQVLAKDVCHHIASPDGARVYYVHHCPSYEQRGTLAVLEWRTAAAITLGEKVSMRDVKLSLDGKWLAFVGDMGKTSPDPACNYQGNLYVASASGGDKRLALPLATTVIVPLAGSRFLASTYVSCSTGEGKSMLVDASSASATPRACGAGIVSPDGSRILDVRDGKDMFTKKLYLVRPECGDETFLADDYYQYITATAFLEPIFSSSGKHVLYITEQVAHKVIGLSAVPTAGGPRAPLDTSSPNAYSFTASPHGEEVLLIKDERSELAVVTLAPFARTTIFRSAPGRRLGHVGSQSAELVRGGLELLFVEQPYLSSDPGPATLYHARRGATVALTTLAAWDPVKLAPLYAMAFKVDPNGCAVVYNQDSPLGTYLSALPAR
jgi:hypothetical protein